MASTPAAPSIPDGFQPAFKRVEQSDRFDCAFACIATLTNKTLDEVREVAITKHKFPRSGPYWITEDLIIKLCAHYGLIASAYAELTGPLAQLPSDIAILMIDFDPDTEIGRHVLYHRARTTGGKGSIDYVIDPAYWITDPAMQLRFDLKGLQASFYLAVRPIGKGTAGGK